MKFVLPELFYSLSYDRYVQSAKIQMSEFQHVFPHGGIGRGKIKHGCQCGSGDFRRGVDIGGASSKGTRVFEATLFVKLHDFCWNSVFSFLSAFRKTAKSDN